MSAALALALALAAAGGSSSAPVRADAVQLFRNACVETGFRRADFERLGRERRWRPAGLTQRSGQAGWAVAFRTDGVLVMLMEGPPGMAGSNPDLGAMCSVSFDHAPEGLAAEVTSIAAELGLGDEAAAIPAPGPMRVWSRPGSMTLTYATGADSDPRAVVSLSRQIVISETAPVSPSGN